MNNILAALERGDTLVSASTRQARHWRWRFDQHQRAAGCPGWKAPAIYSFNEWLERQWELSLLAGGEAGEQGLLKPKQSELVWRQVLRDQRAELAGMTTAAGLRAVRRAWQTSQAWGLSLAAVAAQASTPDSAAFADWARSYQALLADRHWTDLVLLPLRLCKDLEQGVIRPPARLAWLGFAEPDPVQRRLDRALQQAGCQTRFFRPAVDQQETRAFAFARAADERSAALDGLLDWYRQAEPSVLALVLPENSTQAGVGLQQSLLDRLSPAWRHSEASELPVSLSRGRSLTGTGMVHAALTALSLAEGRLDYRDFSLLLRSPYLGDAHQEALPRAQLELRLREECQRDLSLAELLSLADFPAPLLQQRLENARQLMRDGGTRREPDAWVGWFETLLDALGWPGRPTLQLDEQVALDSWRGCLEQFGATSPVTGKLSLGAALALLHQMAEEQEFQPGASAGGIQILAPQEALGQCFEGIWIAGLHSEAWPPPALPDPLLPLSLQRQAGIPACSPSAHVAWSEQILQALNSSAPAVVLSYARAENDRLCAPSPAFKALPALAMEEGGSGSDAAGAELIQWQAEMESLPEDPPPALRPTERVRGGSRLLQLQATCPARAFFELRLGAEPLAIPPFGLDAAVRGQLLHQAAQTLYTGLQADSLAPDSEAALALVPAAVQGTMAVWLNARHPLLRVLAELEQQRLIGQLRALLAFDARRPEFQVLGMEQAGQARIGPLELSLRLDRLDQLDGQAQLVIDYKTGRRFTPAAWQGERPSEPQLPLYAIANDVDGIAIVKINADGVSLQGVGAEDFGVPGLKPVERFAGGEFESWQSLCSAWAAALSALATEFADGFAAIDADHPEQAQGQFAPLTRVYSGLPEQTS